MEVGIHTVHKVNMYVHIQASICTSIQLPLSLHKIKHCQGVWCISVVQFWGTYSSFVHARSGSDLPNIHTAYCLKLYDLRFFLLRLRGEVTTCVSASPSLAGNVSLVSYSRTIDICIYVCTYVCMVPHSRTMEQC